MTQLLNNTSGGTNGATVTTGNSGGASGTAFNGVGSSGTNTVVYDNTVSFGGGITNSIKIVGTGTRTLSWTSSWAGASTIYATTTMQVTDATPTAAFSYINAYESDDTTIGCSVRLNVDGKIQLRAPATVQYTSASVMSDNVPWRTRLKVVSSATVGRISAELYIAANLWGSTYDEAFGSDVTNKDTGDGTVGGIAFGMLGDPTSTETVNVTAMGISDVAHIAALGTPPATPTPLNTPGSWVSVGSAGLRTTTHTWAAVPEGTGYRIRFQSLNSGQDGNQDSEWTTMGNSPLTVSSNATTSLIIDNSNGGLDYANTYRFSIQAKV